jgi:hypothetical protein
MDEINADLMAETENYMVWKSSADDEVLFHLELGGVTLHLLSEEWNEFLTLVKMVLD